jgi:hypothetical protein
MPQRPRVPEAGTDRELLRRIVEEDDIQTEPGTRLNALAADLWDWLKAQLGDGPDVSLNGVWELAGVVGLGLLLLAAAWTVWFVTRSPRRKATRPGPIAAVQAMAPPPDPATALELALAAGDARTALRALWAELALRLGQAGVVTATGEDQTHLELVRAVRRDRPEWSGHGELRGLARTFDRLCYGATPPAIADVRALIPQARDLPA